MRAARVLIAVMVCCLAPGVSHAGRTQYAGGAAGPLRLLALAALPWAMVIIVQAQLRIEHRYRALNLLTGFFCAVSLAVPVALGTWFGAVGMAGGWLLSVSGIAALAWWLTGHCAAAAGPVTRDEAAHDARR